MKILVINCGSSSIKYGLFRADRLEDHVSLACGAVSGLGRSDGLLTHETGGRAVQIKLDRPDYRKGLQAILAALSHPEHGVVAEPSEIGLVGHRAVHGGESFTEAVIIDREVIAKMKQCIPLAPIHNPANLEGIRQARALLPRARHVWRSSTPPSTIPCLPGLTCMRSLTSCINGTEFGSTAFTAPPVAMSASRRAGCSDDLRRVSGS